MLYDRIVDKKEIGRTIWKIFTAFDNDLYSVERFALRWMICTTLNGLYYVEWSELHWMICTTLSDLNCVAWFVQRWIICTTLNDLYHVNDLYNVEWFYTSLQNLCDLEWFVQRWKIWMIWNAMDDLYNVESFALRLIIEYRLFNKCQVYLFGKIL